MLFMEKNRRIKEIIDKFIETNAVSNREARYISIFIENNAGNDYFDFFKEMCYEYCIQDYTSDFFIALRKNQSFKDCNKTIKKQVLASKVIKVKK